MHNQRKLLSPLLLIYDLMKVARNNCGKELWSLICFSHSVACRVLADLTQCTFVSDKSPSTRTFQFCFTVCLTVSWCSLSSVIVHAITWNIVKSVGRFEFPSQLVILWSWEPTGAHWSLIIILSGMFCNWPILDCNQSGSIFLSFHVVS